MIIPEIPKEMKPWIFIASSEKAKRLAKALRAKLEEVANVKPWFESFDPGTTTIDTLLERCRECDFAAVLLTKDDLSKKADKKAQVPRDNCIFELGLFTGALGLEPKRSFILTSVDKDALPSDLKGVSYIKIKETIPSVAAAAEQIKKAIVKLEFCYDHPLLKILPTLHLMGREKSKAHGGKLESSGEVMVYSSQPIEKDNDEFANRVQLNMAARVDYNYFFQADTASIKLITNLIRRLVLSGVNIEEPENIKHPDWKLRKNVERARKNLTNMKAHLRIYFLSHQASVQFCIHNAAHLDYAICYLRYSPEQYVEWCYKREAKEVADDLRSRTGSDVSADYVFCGTSDYDFYGQARSDFRRRLQDRIENMFPGELSKMIADVCFRQKKKGKQAAQNPRPRREQQPTP